MTDAEPSGTILLATMALIKANSDQGRTYLDNFTPFVLEVMRPFPEDSVDASFVSEQVGTMIGIEVPTRVAEALLKRLTKQRKLIRDYNRYNLARSIIGSLPNLQSQQATFIRNQESLVDKFVELARTRHGIVYEREDAASALYAYIESAVVDLLRVEVQGADLKGADKEDSYLVADFIAESARADDASYKAILAAAKGSMLAAAIQIPNLEKVQSKFVNTTLYLDAPLLLQLVGLEGPDARAAITAVLRVAREHGADLACFEHSVEEARGVIHFNALFRRRPTRVPTRAQGIQAWAIRENIDYQDLLIQESKFEANVLACDVEIRQKPDHVPSIEVSEDELRGVLDDVVGYRTQEALLRDLDSLVGIHILRGGRSYYNIESSRAVLITDNDDLTRVARQFFRKAGHQWPVATSASDLATILYLKDPHDASSLPDLVLKAGAFAALEPGTALWVRFLEIIESQRSRQAVTSEDIALLCHTEESRRFLMETTCGNAERLTTASVDQVLRRTKENIERPVKEEAAAALQAKASAQEDSARLTEKLESLSVQAGDARDMAEQALRRGEQVEDNVRRVAADDVHKWVTGLLYLLAAVLITPACLGFFGAKLGPEAQMVASVLLFVGVVMGIFATVTGFSLRHVLAFGEAPLAAALERRRRVRIGLSAMRPSEAVGQSSRDDSSEMRS